MQIVRAILWSTNSGRGPITNDNPGIPGSVVRFDVLIVGHRVDYLSQPHTEP
jgi:hypothetical protein